MEAGRHRHIIAEGPRSATCRSCASMFPARTFFLIATFWAGITLFLSEHGIALRTLAQIVSSTFAQCEKPDDTGTYQLTASDTRAKNTVRVG